MTMFGKWIRLAGNNYNRLMVALILLLCALALPEPRSFSKVIILVVVLIAMLSITRRLTSDKWWQKFYPGLIFSSLTVLGLQTVGLFQMPLLRSGPLVFEVLLLLVVGLPIFLIQQELFSVQKVTADTLKGGIAIYLLLGFAWSLVYMIVYQLEPMAFNGITATQFEADFLHFSFVTLTTVGYGDIHPLSPVARIATNLEAIAGVMYPAIRISRLVSLYDPRSQEP